ncbi:MAG: helix-turn-helix domain-containing protein [Alistipes sp.]
MSYGDLRACIQHEMERYEERRKHRKDEMLSERETAEYLNTTVTTIRRWVTLKEFPLPQYSIGARNYYKVKDLDMRIIKNIQF